MERFSSRQWISSETIRNPSEALKFVLATITFSETPKIVGSAAYNVHRYPGDIDIFEEVTISLTRTDAAAYYRNQFQNIAQLILLSNSRASCTTFPHRIIFSDFKAGLDTRFTLPIITQKGTEEKQMQYFNSISQYYSSELISKEEYLRFKEQISSLNFEEFEEEIRQKRTLHWTFEELLAGRKLLPTRNANEIYLNLAEALEMNTIVKLDTISWIETRFQSVEVFYHLQYIDPTNKNNQPTPFHPLANYLESLRKDILYYASSKNYNPLKVLKRMWSYCRMLSDIGAAEQKGLFTTVPDMNLTMAQPVAQLTDNCSALLEKLNPIFSSDASAINQMIADIEVLEVLLEKKSCDIDKIFFETFFFSKRVHNHLPLDKVQIFLQYEKELPSIYNKFVQYNSFDVSTFQSILQNLLSLLKPILRDLSLQFYSEVVSSSSNRNTLSL